jgi:hypothetical protein
LFNGPHIINMIKSSRLRWLGNAKLREEGTSLSYMEERGVGKD